jgi:hypothetical protein
MHFYDNVWRQTLLSAKTDVWRQTMFSAKHFDKHFCLSLENTSLLTYKKSFQQPNNPAIFESGNCRIISGIKLPNCRIILILTRERLNFH